jgi:catalase
MATPSSSPTPQQQQVYEKLVDTLQAIFGAHPGYRPAHAKGVVCQGTFAASAAAASLSRAAHFQGSPVPVTVRFSDSTGIPTIPDGDPNASPRGVAVRFHLPGGVETDIVAHSFNGFPVGTAEEFLAFLQAVAASGPDATRPTPIEVFLSSRPRAATFVTAAKPAPKSFATESYYAAHAFAFINREGARKFARYQIHPAEGRAHLSSAEAAQMPPNYLFDELSSRLAHAPAKLRLVAQLAEPGDPIDNASIPWPDERPQIELGAITITKRLVDSDAMQRRLIFDPVRLTDGIELSGDPLPQARSAVYSVSYSRRNA